MGLAKVRNFVLGRKGQKLADVEHMDAYLHTGILENMNSILGTQYAKKYHVYSWKECGAGAVWLPLITTAFYMTESRQSQSRESCATG